MKRWSPASEYITEASSALKAGMLVGMPTETVYGLAGNALNGIAVARIFAAKGRPYFDPLIVHAGSTEQAFALVNEVPDEARALAQSFWPGPLTLVLRHVPHLLSDLISSGLPTVALRVPAHPVARELIDACGFPLAAPSANRFGRISPTTAAHVIEELSSQDVVAGVLDAGPCGIGVESTVVAFPEGGGVVVLRPGGLPFEQLEKVVGRVGVFRSSGLNEEESALVEKGMQSPGMLARHYAPVTPLILLEQGASPEHEDATTGWLGYDHVPAGVSGPAEILSPQGDMAVTASRLFSCLRALDTQGVSRIVAWKVPEAGLGRAINDRLLRASRR